MSFKIEFLSLAVVVLSTCGAMVGTSLGDINCLAGQQCNCSSGTCVMRCPTDGACQVGCTGSSCTTHCNGANPCQVTCGSAASCTQHCTSGNCQLTSSGAALTQQNCNSASACLTTCGANDRCSQAAGSGTHTCTGCN